MSIESLLEDALESRTADVRPDPASRELIAAQLTETAASTPVRRWALPAAAAAVLLIAGGGVLVARAGNDNSHSAPADHSRPSPTYLPGFLLPSAEYFIATQRSGANGAVHDLVVRASDHRVVGALPAVGGKALSEPQLTRGGTRAYAIWGNGTRLGYVDVQTGKATVLIHRTGEIASPTISADGSTLAYAWTPKLDGKDVTEIVVRNLSTGAERVLPDAPAGPQELPIALSPDGSRLAVVPTDRSRRPLWIVPTTGSDVFAHPTTIAGAACGSGRADEPRWTAHGLFALRHCTAADDTTTSSDLVSVDPDHNRARVLRHTAGAETLFMTVLDTSSGPVFVTADETHPDDVIVYIRDPRHGWSATIHGFDGLAVSGAE